MHWPAVIFLIQDKKFQRLGTIMEIIIHNGWTRSRMCFANKLFCVWFFGEIFAALVSPQIQSIWNVWHTIWEKAICHERDFGRVYKLASCLQEVFHTTWEKKSFHFTEFTENTQSKTFSMKFPKKVCNLIRERCKIKKK